MKSFRRKQNVVWGGLMILFGIMGYIDTLVEISAWSWVTVLVLAGLGAFAVFLTARNWWGLLIPPYALWAVAALVSLLQLNVLRDAWIAGYVLTAVALPFVVVYLRDRQQWWALIPAYVLLAIGLMVVLLEGTLRDFLIPAYVMLAIAAPFLVVFARDRRQWWALIPGGITAIVGIAFLMAEATVAFVLPVALILAGALIILRQFTRRESGKLATGVHEPPVE